MLTIWIVRPVFLQEKYWEKAKAQRRFFCREEERRSERKGIFMEYGRKSSAVRDDEVGGFR